MVEPRTYRADEVAGFLKTRERFGALSNMASGYPILVLDMTVASTEHLYQALRYPHLPDFQREILDQPNAMLAKRKAYERQLETRKDWRDVNVRIMRHCLDLKLAHNHARMSAHYRETGNLPIVEISHRDPFWGAKPSNGMLEGVNALGRLHMGLRQRLHDDPGLHLLGLDAPDFPGAILCGIKMRAWRRPVRGKALNARRDGKEPANSIYIGRPSDWGNPFAIGKDGDRSEVLAKYLDHLHRNPDIVDRARRELAGKDLVCWCAPAACHGDILCDLAAGCQLPEPHMAVAMPGPDQAAFSF
ncbi:DUF4326 domain-containing protein [Paracoccus sp. ME4]|uniref:DUF4326 domain-containing protein n=1 Tax=Paracoccus sp. ME4 TaxID=3138066 RepID=UPI00398A6EB6